MLTSRNNVVQKPWLSSQDPGSRGRSWEKCGKNMGKPWENCDLMVVQWDLMVVQWCLHGDLMVPPSFVCWFSFTP